MRSRLFLNLLLFCCVVALASILIMTPEEPPAVSIKKLTGIESEMIRTIQIEQPDREPVTFSKQDDRWIMTRPYQVPANNARVKAILRVLSAQSHGQFAVSEKDLVRFRLDSPRVTLRIDDQVILFGDTEALDERRYVLVDNTVHLISDTLYPQLTSAATVFINPRLLPDDAEIISLQLPDHTLQMNGGQWSIVPPDNIASETLPDLIRAWQQAAAITISAYQQSEHRGVIQVQLSDNKHILFKIMAVPPRAILARPDLGIQYHLDSHTADQLFIPVSKTEANPTTEKQPQTLNPEPFV